jgi:F-type H+-transporting ATPase subunit epsilon
MAAADVLTLEVATPAGMQLRTEADSVATPSVNGEFAVLPGHVPLLASLRCGLLKYFVKGKPHVAAIGPGFVEAEPTKVELLTDLFALPKDIDVERARKDLSEAGEALKRFDQQHEGAEYLELQRDLEWAQARLDAVAEHERF